jgi:hypothetical protein
MDNKLQWTKKVPTMNDVGTWFFVRWRGRNGVVQGMISFQVIKMRHQKSGEIPKSIVGISSGMHGSYQISIEKFVSAFSAYDCEFAGPVYVGDYGISFKKE